jgi:hypothetical protein
MTVDRFKSIFAALGRAKTMTTVVVLGVALLGPRTFRDLPYTTLVAAVAKSPQTAPEQIISLNLNIVIKCFAEPSRMCSRDVLKFIFPGMDLPKVEVPKDFTQNINGPNPSGPKDVQGRTRYEIQILRPLRGGDTIVTNVPINGRVVYSDLKLETIKGIDVLRIKFGCKDANVEDPFVSQLVCEEEFGWVERIASIVSFK